MKKIMDQIKYNPNYYTKRWVGYFDLLGTKTLVNSQHHVSIFSIYCKAIEEVKKRNATLPCIEHAWFSDTFILYTDDESLSSFAELDHISRWFFYFLIEGRIPARGAISFGEFYADKENSLFFGKALIEAYEYGEAQEWIGFLLCPSAETVLKKIGFFTGNSSPYAFANIPYKKRKETLNDRLPACILGSWIEMNKQNPSLKSLYEMRAQLSDEKIIRKYDNAIVFIEKHKRTVTL